MTKPTEYRCNWADTEECKTASMMCGKCTRADKHFVKMQPIRCPIIKKSVRDEPVKDKND